MYVEKDKDGNIIIQAIRPDEAEIIDDMICTYLAGKPLNGRTDTERTIIMLKKQLEKLY